jgi:hypothetical protein
MEPLAAAARAEAGLADAYEPPADATTAELVAKAQAAAEARLEKGRAAALMDRLPLPGAPLKGMGLR